jgi:hypothetical protein
MEARLFSAALIAASALSLGANHPTQNFIITAATPELAHEIGQAAESYRRNLAVEWLGHELPPWQEPCPVTTHVAPQLGAGGATSFYFDHGRPFGWRMNIQGSHDRLLDSVLPHEVTHMIFATHFGCPLPRWADEGACTTVEHVSEKAKQQQMLITFLTTGRGIAFNQMFAMREYPADILPLYSQGFSLARYLIALGGKPRFVQYVGDGMKGNNWTAATKQHYGFASLSELQVTWLAWVRQGSPPVSPATTMVAQQASPSAITTAVADMTRPASYSSTDQSTPAAMQLASVSSEGWYAKRRDSARSASATTAVAENAAPPAPLIPQSKNAAELTRDSVTRPQAIGTPAATALQWSAAPAGNYLQPVPVSGKPASSGYTAASGRY